MNDNPRLFNNPPRDTKEWKTEYNARTSAERSNKREKIDFKLESGRHRSTKMWYCRLYHILMLQHLDAWDLPKPSMLNIITQDSEGLPLLMIVIILKTKNKDNKVLTL
jgi:hypothetical protein